MAIDRELPKQYASARGRLEARLVELGFELASECYYPDAFGSASSEYRQGRRGSRVQLHWDGKDSSLWLSVSTPVADGPPALGWRPLEAASTRPSSIKTVRAAGEVLEERIAQLLEAIEERFGSLGG